MDFQERLREFEKKYITKPELEKLAGTSSDEKLFLLLADAEKDGIIKSVESSKTNGNLVYPIHMKYHILHQNENQIDFTDEINKLHPSLLKSGYLQKKQKQYPQWQDQLKMLSPWLFKSSSNRIPISRKERSFEIFGEEKQLDKSNFRNLLKSLELNEKEIFCFFDTPENCFSDYIPKRLPKMNLLICENKDIWYDIRKILFETECRTLWDTPVDGVIYGNGNKICKPEALTDYTNFLGDADVKYFYWGDIDREGLNIFTRLCKQNQSLDISPFRCGYLAMLELARQKSIPKSDDKRNICDDYSLFFKSFLRSEQQEIQFVLDKNLRLPQEIVTYEILLGKMR